jgi:hypothetical protein
VRVGTHDSPRYAALSALRQGGAARGPLTLTCEPEEVEREDDEALLFVVADDLPIDEHSDGSLAFNPMQPQAGDDSDADSDAGV